MRCDHVAQLLADLCVVTVCYCVFNHCVDMNCEVVCLLLKMTKKPYKLAKTFHSGRFREPVRDAIFGTLTKLYI